MKVFFLSIHQSDLVDDIIAKKKKKKNWLWKIKEGLMSNKLQFT